MKRVRLAAVVAAFALLPASAGAETINVTSNLDNGTACTLREAVSVAVSNVAANGCTRVADGNGVRDTIVLSVVGPYSLTAATTDELSNANGDIDVGAGGPITIQGSGQTLSQTVADRVFETTNVATDLTLRDFNVNGGDSRTLMDTYGGNIKATAAGNSITLDNVDLVSGDADFGAGIALTGSGSTLSIVDSKVGSNTAKLKGGGIHTEGSVDITITRSELSNNHATSNVDGNTGVSGGAISYDGDSLTISDTTIADNDATNNGTSVGDKAFGGGVAAYSETTIRRSLIVRNTAKALDTDASSFERGGGIYGNGGGAMEPIAVVNSTIFDNLAGDAGNTGHGGGVYNSGPGPLSLTHVTFLANEATFGDGDHVEAAGSVTLLASILPGDNPCAGTDVISAGSNVANANDHECYFNPPPVDSISLASTGLVGIAPADNGGFTDTFALAPGSRAADLVPSCPQAEGQDQRGISRPQGAGCDAGAFELQCTTPSSLPGCPPLAVPISAPAVAAGPCDNLSGKAKKKCLCKQKKGKKRKKCLKRLKGRKP
jgi:predicted outer membrane repeat protein